MVPGGCLRGSCYYQHATARKSSFGSEIPQRELGSVIVVDSVRLAAQLGQAHIERQECGHLYVERCDPQANFPCSNNCRLHTHREDCYRPIPDVMAEHPGEDGYCYFNGASANFKQVPVRPRSFVDVLHQKLAEPFLAVSVLLMNSTSLARDSLQELHFGSSTLDLSQTLRRRPWTGSSDCEAPSTKACTLDRCSHTTSRRSGPQNHST